jgi:hypothetical protein
LVARPGGIRRPRATARHKQGRPHHVCCPRNLLLVAGAIVTFAVDRQAEGFDLNALGWILMAGGGLCLIVALFTSAAWWSNRGSRIHTEGHAGNDGRAYVEDTRIS